MFLFFLILYLPGVASLFIELLHSIERVTYFVCLCFTVCKNSGEDPGFWQGEGSRYVQYFEKEAAFGFMLSIRILHICVHVCLYFLLEFDDL